MIKRILNYFFRLPYPNEILSKRVKKILPYQATKVVRLARSKWWTISDIIRINRKVTGFLGPEFPPTHKKIEIDVTYHCNHRCRYCNRFLDFAPTDICMSIEQIKKFIKESIEIGRKWECIFLSGGEPILHPQISEIANLIVAYKNDFSPDTKIWLLISGIEKQKDAKLPNLPKDIDIIDSQKNTSPQVHIPMTIAPVDIDEYRKTDFSNGCWIPQKCAMGLNLYGYYQCAIAGAIDRIFGFDMGRKKLPTEQDNMMDLYRKFCGYCGFFIRTEMSKGKKITPTWEKAINDYMRLKSFLTLY